MIHGIDVSKWQGRMTWATAVAAGARFAYIRAGFNDGANKTDEQFENNYLGSKGLLPIGFYWYLNLQASVEKQAGYFASLLAKKSFDLPPAIDVEEAGNVLVVKQFAALLVSEFSMLPLIYTRANIWDNLIGDKAWAKEYPLWVAHYGVSTPDLPETWDAWQVWQISSKDNGAKYGAESKSIDHDIAQESFIQGGGGSGQDLATRLAAAEVRISNVEARLTVLEQAKPGEAVTIYTPKGQAVARFISDRNKAGKPIFEIYPSNSALVSARVIIKAPVAVKPEALTGDGGQVCYELVSSPAKVPLYVRAQDGSITKP